MMPKGCMSCVIYRLLIKSIADKEKIIKLQKKQLKRLAGWQLELPFTWN